MNASHKRKPHTVRAFLIRLWRDGPEEPWRALAKQVTDGREFHFASPEKLFLFLHEQTTNDDRPTTNDGRLPNEDHLHMAAEDTEVRHTDIQV